MQVLVATNETQGARKNDFCWTDAGELVTFGFECDGEAIDGHCGCRRSMVGVKSSRATTTVQVAERDMTLADLKAAYLMHLVDGGWGKAEDPAIIHEAKTAAERVLRVAGMFPVGTVLERREKWNARLRV